MDGLMMNGKRILYISYDGMTDPLGQSQVLPYLEGLSRLGNQIVLLSCEKPARAAVRPRIEAICSAAGIEWHPIPYTKKPPVLSTVKDVRALAAAAEKLHRRHNFDGLHCRSYIPALIALGIKKKFGLPFIFDMRGFWADERVDGALWNLSNPVFRMVYRFFKRKERAFLQEAAVTVSLTHEGKREIESWLLPRAAPITVIPCCVDTTLFDPARIGTNQRNAQREALRIPTDHEVVGYVGSVGTWYLIDEMLHFFKAWLRLRPNTILLFVSNEPENVLRRYAEAVGLDWNVVRVIQSPRAEVPAYIATMEYGLFFIKPAYSKKASSPVKQGELMAMGLPVVCNAGVGDTDDIVQRYGSGVLVNSFDDAAYNAAIEAVTMHSFDGARIRAGAHEYFGLDGGIASYAAVYASLPMAKRKAR